MKIKLVIVAVGLAVFIALAVFALAVATGTWEAEPYRHVDTHTGRACQEDEYRNVVGACVHLDKIRER